MSGDTSTARVVTASTLGVAPSTVDEQMKADGIDAFLVGSFDPVDDSFVAMIPDLSQWDYDALELDNSLDTFMKNVPGLTVNQPSLPSANSTEMSSFTPSSQESAVAPSDKAFQLVHGVWPAKASIPPVPTVAVRSLIQRPKLQANTQRTADLIFATLKSYPLILRQNALPPFIHPSLVDSEAENLAMEPLINAINLSRMVSAGIQGSRKLFWRNVKVECERFSAQVCCPVPAYIGKKADMSLVVFWYE